MFHGVRFSQSSPQSGTPAAADVLAACCVVNSMLSDPPAWVSGWLTALASINTAEGPGVCIQVRTCKAIQPTQRDN